MESYYEFTVSFNGHHLFATAPRSFPASSPERAEEFYNDLCYRFPESEGYGVTVTKWACTGYECTLEWIKNRQYRKGSFK